MPRSFLSNCSAVPCISFQSSTNGPTRAAPTITTLRPLGVPALHSLKSRSTIDGAVYTLDADGNRAAKQDDLAGVTSNYTYDKIYELTQVTQGANTTESYSYDPVGNRLSSLGLSPYNANTSNELTSTPSTSYTYDNNGNTTSKTNSSGTTIYAWDYENRLTTVTLPGQGGTVTFKYDPFGRRIYKSSSSGTMIYAYDGDNVVETTDQTGAILSRFAQGQNIDEPLAESTSAGTDYYEADGLGSITSLTNGTGTIAQTYTYDSFGNTTNSTGSLTNPFQYAARDFDSATGLYYYRARYYDPTTIGRFISEDGLGFDGGDVNFYRYVWNSPLDYIDPFGWFGFGVQGGASAGAGLGPGAVGTAGGGIGIFGGNGLNTGAYGYAGGFAGLGPYGLRYPNPREPRNWGNGYVLGYGADVAAGLFGTNAKSVCDLRGPFKTFTIGGGLLFGGELQVAWSNGIVIVSGSITISPLPFPSAMASLINTNTSVMLPTGGDCGCN